MKWVIQPLGRDHDRDQFACGSQPLNDFLLRYATQYAKRNLARTYVAVRAGEVRVLGYYCLSCGGVPFENWPQSTVKRLPEHPVPVVLLGRLAVDQSVHDQGLGGQLLRD